MIEEGQSWRGGRFATTADALRRFASTLTLEDHVVREATCNTEAIARVLRQHAGRVVMSNPLRTRAILHRDSVGTSAGQIMSLPP